MDHLDKAKHLAGGGYDSLRYAVLELRYAIECLVYELLPGYEDELPDEVREAWRPSEILREMVSCNPGLPQTVSVAMGFERPDGTRGPAMHMGTQTGLTPSSLLKDYARLGHFLHAQKPDGQPHDEAALRRSMEKVIGSLERYRGDTIIANLAERHQFSCHACGRKILRRPRAFDLNPFVRCPNKECRAIHERIREDGEYLFRMVQEHFTCPDCGIGSFFDQHLLQPGTRIRCRGCSKEFDLRMVVVPSSQAG
jgi:hypothetical protein